jgi:E3 ubiquitin-protein ligase MYCBP2
MLHTTPSRFTRTNQSRTWNTGNGSPDAICFSVDRSGVVVAGVCVYGGVGTYEYELELLDDVSRAALGVQGVGTCECEVELLDDVSRAALGVQGVL